MSPELAEAVEIVVARTRHERYRHLAETSPDYARLILEMAAGPAPEPTPQPAPVVVVPFRLGLDLCPSRRSCSCRLPILCVRDGPEPAPRTLDECRACLGL